MKKLIYLLSFTFSLFMLIFYLMKLYKARWFVLYMLWPSYGQIDGIYYDFSDTSAIVTKGHRPYSGYITIPETVKKVPVTSIGEGAFSDCWDLTSIIIPNSVTSIGEKAFYSCGKLKAIYCLSVIPPTVEGEIFNYPEFYYSCTLYIPEGEKVLQSYENTEPWCNFQNIVQSKRTLLRHPVTVTVNGLNYTLNDVLGTAEVTSYAYDNPKSESSVKGNIVIPPSIMHNGCQYRVTFIDNLAFNKCKPLKSITIHALVNSIGESAFKGCSALEVVTLPNSVTSIGPQAFEYCESLKSIEIPNSVTSIDGYAFNGCESLKSIEIPKSVTSIGGMAFCGCKSLKSIEIPKSVTSIEEGTFYGCESLKSIEIPKSVTSIGKKGFAYCESIQSIEIPNSVTSIEDGAFYECKELTSIIIPNSVTSVGSEAFLGCTSLESVVIGNSVAKIGQNTFSDDLYARTYDDNSNACPLKNIYCLGNIPPDCARVNFEGSYYYPFNNSMFSSCTLFIPEGEKVLQSYETTEPWCNFQNIVQLKQADFPSSL